MCRFLITFILNAPQEQQQQNIMRMAHFSPNGTCYNNELWPDLLICAMNQLKRTRAAHRKWNRIVLWRYCDCVIHEKNPSRFAFLTLSRRLHRPSFKVLRFVLSLLLALHTPRSYLASINFNSEKNKENTRKTTVNLATATRTTIQLFHFAWCSRTLLVSHSPHAV